MTPKQIQTAKKKIKKLYGLKRVITDNEVISEINNLKRKNKNGNLDDFSMNLFNELSTGQNSINLEG
jgi:hypothetical protein